MAQIRKTGMARTKALERSAQLFAANIMRLQNKMRIGNQHPLLTETPIRDATTAYLWNKKPADKKVIWGTIHDSFHLPIGLHAAQRKALEEERQKYQAREKETLRILTAIRTGNLEPATAEQYLQYLIENMKLLNRIRIKARELILSTGDPKKQAVALRFLTDLKKRYRLTRQAVMALATK
jgi:hypothetical protein